MARLFAVPYFFVRSFRYTTITGILIFKGTEGAGVGDYSSEGGGGGGGRRGEKNRGTVIT